MSRSGEDEAERFLWLWTMQAQGRVGADAARLLTRAWSGGDEPDEDDADSRHGISTK